VDDLNITQQQVQGNAVVFTITGGTPGTSYEIASTINTTINSMTVTRTALQPVSDVDL
jgi:hypothetical protein